MRQSGLDAGSLNRRASGGGKATRNMDPNPYETPDLNLAAGLVVAGHALSHIERRDGRAWFVFDPDPGLAGTATRYYTSNLLVDARGYADTLRALKAALHEAAVSR